MEDPRGSPRAGSGSFRLICGRGSGNGTANILKETDTIIVITVAYVELILLHRLLNIDLNINVMTATNRCPLTNTNENCTTFGEDGINVAQCVSLLTRIICTESENYVAIVWNGDSVLGRWQIELSVEETPLVQIQRVLQINLFHVLVGGTADTNHVEGVAVQVEWMRQVRLLYCEN